MKQKKKKKVIAPDPCSNTATPRLPPASSAVPHSPRQSSPERDQGTARAGFPLSIALRRLFGALGANLSSCSASLCTAGFRLSEPFMNESRLSHRGVEKRCKMTVLLPFPHTPGVSSWVLLISDFSTPNPKLCILGWSREAGTPLRQTWRETSSRCCSPYEMHLSSLVQHKQCRWGPLHFQAQAQTNRALPGNCLEKS